MTETYTLALWKTPTEGMYYFIADDSQGILTKESAEKFVERTLANGGVVVGWEEEN